MDVTEELGNQTGSESTSKSQGESGRAGPYRLLELLGRGGNGQVWRAVHEELGREVAIKMLPAGLLGDPDLRERLRREGLAAARLRHPGIVTLLEVGEHRGEVYLVLEFVRGRSLADRLTEGPLPAREAAVVVRALADAVQHAHDAGVIHRDLKPANVLLDAERNGAPRLTDFGIARLPADLAASWTLPGTTLGSPAYLAPEQIGGGGASQGRATDVYGLGAVLFHCLTGRPPFSGQHPGEVLRAVAETDAPSPRTLVSELSRDWETLCAKCLVKDPADRYGSAAELRAELDRWLDGEPLRARPVSFLEQARRWRRRRPALSLALMMMVLSGVTGLVATAWQWRRAKHSAAAYLNQLTQAENFRGEGLMLAGDPREALAVWTRNLRRQPSDTQALVRILSMLRHRPWARPILELGPHPGTVLVTDWSPDGRTVLTGAGDGGIRTWDADSGIPTMPARENGAGEWNWLKYSPDGKWVGALMSPGNLRIWRSDELTVYWEQGVTNLSVVQAAFHPREASLVLRRSDHSMELWDLATRQRRHAWTADEEVMEFALSPKGSQLAVAERGGTVRVMDVKSGHPVGNPIEATGILSGVSWHPAGHFLALTLVSNRTVELRSWPEGKRVRAVRHDGRRPARFGPSGFLARYVSATKTMSAFDPLADRDVYRVSGVVGFGLDGPYSRDGEHGAIALTPRAVLAFDAWHGERLIERIETRSGVTSASLSSDGKRLVIAAGLAQAMIWDVGRQRGTSKGGQLPRDLLAVGFTAAGEQVRSVDASGRIWEQHCRIGRPEVRAQVGWRVVQSVFDESAERVAVAGVDGTLEVWDVARGRRMAGPWAGGGEIVALSFSADGAWLAAGTREEELLLMDLRPTSGQTNPPHRLSLGGLAPRKGLATGVTSLEFSPNSRELAIAAQSGRAWVVEVETRAIRRSWEHPDAVAVARFSPTGHQVATACADGGVRVWDRATGDAVLRAPLLHDEAATELRFSPAGPWLASAGRDNAIRVWSLPSGGLLTRIRTEVACQQMAITRDGRGIAGAAGKSGNRVWDVQTGFAMTEKLMAQKEVDRIVVSPGERWSAVWKQGVSGWVFPVLQRPPGGGSSTPGWVFELADAVAGMRYGAGGQVEVVTPAEWRALEDRLRRYQEPDPYWREFLTGFLTRSESSLAGQAETF